MDVTSLTVGLPVSDLQRSREWYARLLQSDETPLEPVDGVLEHELSPGHWLQIFQTDSVHEAAREAGSVVVRFGVADVAAERQRLLGLGIEVDALVRVEGVLEYADFPDPDGHRLTIYTML